ncbi:FUSC family protein [Flavihumibacter sp. R14]|nr:FUSC family protein [Flavihumibacter soli]
MNQSREIKTFVFSQYFSDGLRITFGVLLPALICYQLDKIEIGLTISLGALCVSIVDNPGPVLHKRNGMLFCNLFVFITAILTGYINEYPILVGVEIVALSFFYSMFSVYGPRVSAIGTAALLIMILSIDPKLSVFGAFEHAVYILAGGLWYLVLSLSVSQIRPFRPAQQELGECIKEVAKYVRLKAAFYDTRSDVQKNYKALIDQQVIIHQQQDSVREILYKSRLVMSDSTTTGRMLILTFVDIVDLFEQTMATFYDYEAIRKTYGYTGVLNQFKSVIEKIAEELEDLSYIITSNYAAAKMNDMQPYLNDLKNTIDLVEAEHGLNNLVLKKILVNVRNMASRTQKIYSYFNPKSLANEEIRSKTDLDKFVSHQDFGIKNFRDNLNIHSAIFRHAIRVALVMLIGYLVSKLFPFGHHSYWILLTILVILKPGFSLTKQRNYERLIGTVAGGLAGAFILIFITDQTVLFILLLLFMIASYSFQRLNYVVSVIFMTPYILILFHFLGASDNLMIAQERITDTLVGSAIALAANYFVLPTWEYHQLKNNVREVLIANYQYLLNAANLQNGKPLDITAYKLTRKAVYVSSANIGTTFQRMLSEPKSKQKNVRELHRFVVLNHILSSYTATLISTLQQRTSSAAPPEHIKLVRKSLNNLHESIRLINHSDFPISLASEIIIPHRMTTDTVPQDYDSRLLSEQLELVKTTSSDILKITGLLTGKAKTQSPS